MTSPTLVEEVFLAALEKPDPHQRGLYLDAACQGDQELRRRVERLLAAHPQGRAALEPPPRQPEATAAFGVAQPIGTIVAGRYKLLEQIGEGGMGTVWVAEQSVPVRRKVALKLIKPGMDSKSVLARFEAERQALAIMDHPNIAKVLDGGVEEHGRPYFVMEYVKGMPITQYCDDARLTVQERLELFIPVCQAVQHAHQKGVVHRDLKPSNVLVCLYDGHAVPKIIDFGLAKAMHQPLTEHTLHTAHGVMMGTPIYMSPEQAEFNNLDVDTRTDVYSLGVILYELLTGTTPLEKRRFESAALQEMLRLIKEEEPARPSTRLSTSGTAPSIAAQRRLEPVKLSRLLRGDLDWIVMKALEKDRNRRYSTPHTFAEDVERYLRREAILARPPSATYKLKKFMQRNRAGVFTALLVLLALIAGITGTTIGMIRAINAERAVAEERDLVKQERDAANLAKQHAFEALTDLTDNTVGQILSRSREYTPEERAFLDRIVERYERLIASLPDTADSMEMRAKSLQSVGNLQRELGDFNRAHSALTRANEIFAEIHAQAKDDPDAAENLVDSLIALCVVNERMGRTAESERQTDQAIDLAERLHQQSPSDEGVSLSLAVSYHNRSFRRWSDVAGRLEDLNRGVDLSEAVFSGKEGTRPSNVLAACLCNRARHYASVGNLTACRTDVARIEELASIYPSVEFLTARGQSLLNLALALANANQPDAAVAAAQEATSTLGVLVDQYPGNVDNLTEFTSACRQLAGYLRGVGRGEEADQRLRQGAAVAERLARSERASTAALAERTALAVALAQASFDSAKKTGDRSDLDLACRTFREFLAAYTPPEPRNTAAAHTELLRQAQRCREVGQLAEWLKAWPEAIEFGRRQLEFAQAVESPAADIQLRAFHLRMTAKWSFAISYTGMGNAEQAQANWEEWVRLIVWDDPGRVDDIACKSIAEVATQLTTLGASADPAQAIAEGVRQRQSQLDAEPDAVKPRLELRRGYRVLGLIQEYLLQHAAALESCDRGLAESSKDMPRSMADSDIVHDMLTCRAVCLDALGRDAEAEAAWEAHRQSVGGAEGGSGWFRIQKLLMHGRHERAVALAEQRLAKAPRDLDSMYNVACMCSKAAACASVTEEQKDHYVRRAIELLQSVEKDGYFAQEGKWEHAQRDTDLDPIRDHEGFKSIVAAHASENTGSD